jgi:CheY-like chemotaxis protein
MRPKLLLVDDELSIRESLRKLLQAEQYEVVLAVDGKEAVDKFRGDPTHFDLVLTDLNMPVRNGWASIDRLLEVNPLLPIVLFTGMPNQRDLAESSRVSALVEKPIDVPAFLSLIRELLAGQRSQLPELALGRQPFQYLHSNQNFGKERSGDPYSHWGLNE